MVTSTMQKSPDNLKDSISRKSTKPKIAKTRSTVKGKSKLKASERLRDQIYRQGREAVSTVYESASEVGARASRAMPDLRHNLNLRARSQSLYTTVEEHPLVIGAVGLGVGMVLAALLPSANTTRHKR